MIQVIGIFAIVSSIIIELIILLPNIVVSLWITIKGMISKKSKLKADGVKKNLLIYDWVLESVYNERMRQEQLASKIKARVATIDTRKSVQDGGLDSSPRKRLKSMNQIKPQTPSGLN